MKEYQRWYSWHAIVVDHFSMVISPSSLSVQQGGSATATITLPGFGIEENSTAALTATGVPNGVNVTFSPNPVTLAPGVLSNLTVTVSVSRDVNVGNYTLTITAVYLSFTHQAVMVLEVTSPRCVIATAAYGSELVGPVQFLRNFRDHEVQSTMLGSAFMTAFNAWYYSWAPLVAQRIAANENAQWVVRIIITPLILSLSLAQDIFQAAAPLNSEAAILLAGFVASSLIGLTYLALPMCLIMYHERRRGSRVVYGIIASIGLTLALYATLSHGTLGLVQIVACIYVVEIVLLTPAAVARRVALRLRK